MDSLLAVRVKDGIFVGNVAASRDPGFLGTNKVTHVINCAGMETGNTFQAYGMHYLQLHWRDAPGVQVIDASTGEGRTVKQLREFIDKPLSKGECVLIHSIFGVNRCCVAAASYLMSKYKLPYDIAVSYLQAAHPDMNIKPYFSRQLRSLSKRVSSPSLKGLLSTEYDMSTVEPDVLVLRNTYLNSLGLQHVKNAALRNAVEAEAAKKRHAKKKVLTFAKVLEQPQPQRGLSLLPDKNQATVGILQRKDPPLVDSGVPITPNPVIKTAHQAHPSPPLRVASPCPDEQSGFVEVTNLGIGTRGRQDIQMQSPFALHVERKGSPPPQGFSRCFDSPEPMKRRQRIKTQTKNSFVTKRQQMYESNLRNPAVDTGGGDALSLGAIGFDVSGDSMQVSLHRPQQPRARRPVTTKVHRPQTVPSFFTLLRAGPSCPPLFFSKI
eukprot:TRINITY_DN6193_c0_g1_i4.p1 TRINITY_DN6193_c0_g1~~TRINITY_DN6193_c0_g1_i4.p1  ORF type:complete len:437 (+),score=57.74 TRINITY_DN6193_c0_g1_i4:479-1789(+)